MPAFSSEDIVESSGMDLPPVSDIDHMSCVRDDAVGSLFGHVNPRYVTSSHSLKPAALVGQLLLIN